MIAIANIFVYFVRYGVLDWAPTYLSEEKDFNLNASGWAYFLYEWAGIPGTLLCGYISDKVFKGRRGPAGFIFMLGVTIAVVIYWLNRSEEHTSELQSRFDLVCRLLLEKKKY